MNALAAILIDRIGREGPVPYEDVIDLALYDPAHGFYATGGQAGRSGDFLTSPEVGPLFGAVMARALDTWWDELGRPDPFCVVEAGAGVATLARTVRAAAPACRAALHMLAVERSAALRARHPSDVTSLADLPEPDGPAVVLANELLDNLAFGLLEKTNDGWFEVRVDVAPDGGGLAEVLAPAGADLLAVAAPPAAAAPGARLPVQAAAATWLRRALAVAGDEGRVVVFDYVTTSADLVARPWTDWVRTYAGHGRGGHPLVRLGHQDVTVEVCADLLSRVRPPTTQRTQADFLRAHGIDALVEEGRRQWAERAHIGDLSAVAARSRVTEAAALCDPAGLGAFGVLEWTGRSAQVGLSPSGKG
jgi:SAM-dependent MidA family methyltransferase